MAKSDFIKEYIKGTKSIGAYGHLGYKGDKLFNYSTVICIIDRENKTAKFNCKRYSATTSRNQSILRGLLKSEGFEITDYVGESATMWNWGYMGADNVTVEDMRNWG